MSIKEALHRYRGNRDERIVAEMNKIYKNGFIALSYGLVVYLVYGLMKSQVLLVNGITDSASIPLSQTILHGWFLVVMIACVIATTGKGFVDDGRFAETGSFPLGYFLLCSIAAALATGVGSALLRMLAELEIVGPDGILWVADIAIALVFSTVTFLFCLLGCYLSFVAAKRRRDTLARRLEDQ